MSTSISRLYNFVSDRDAGIPIKAQKVDDELNQLITACNRKVLISSSAPSSPIDGQTWIDISQDPPVLKVYDGTNSAWKMIGTYNILTKVAEIDVSSDSDYVDITGLDGNNEEFYILEATIKNPTGSNSEYHLFVEGDTTVTNYYNQYLDVDGTSTTPNRANNPSFAYALAGASTFAVVHITKSPTGYFHFTSHESRHQDNIFLCLRAGIKSNATISNITQLRIQAQQTGGIGTGSRFVLFRAKIG